MFDFMSRIEGSEIKEETEQYWTHISGSDLLASLLPGIVTMLCKIITEPNKVIKYSEPLIYRAFGGERKIEN